VDPWALVLAGTSQTWVDLRPVAPEPLDLEPPALAPAEEPTAAAPALLADVTASAPDPHAPRVGRLAVTPAAAAPDSGDGAGQDRPTAFRRDRSTLRARLTDGADTYQPSRERTGGLVSSPEALRREARVGVGDARRTQVPGGATAPPSPLPEAAPGTPDDAPAAASAVAGAPGPGTDRLRAEGALDAERGARAFDTETVGPARDSLDVRAASDEPRPGLADLSAPSTPGPGTAGRGAAAAPGVVPRPSPGQAPAVAGAPVPVAHGADTALNTLERPYSREHLEIRQRVARQFRFPKRLALMLEQGETVLRFLVLPNGRISGRIQVVKSAGFAEFDNEAVAMVERASPFPSMAHPLLVTMPVAFDNPLIR
jgi:TonB family protein